MLNLSSRRAALPCWASPHVCCFLAEVMSRVPIPGQQEEGPGFKTRG
jgi:hypothetical protein